MKHDKNPIPATTVSVDAATRDRINAEAERLGLSQRQMVQRMLETYETQQLIDKGELVTDEQKVDRIYEALEKVVKRDDRIVAFIKEQEKVLLNPILSTVQATDANLNQLVEILSNIK